jgi:ParB family chromosome partitioning protein
MAKKGLGKGLDALFGDVGAEDIIASKPLEEKDGSAVTLKIVDIEPNKDQPRTDFDEEALLELTESIAEHGVITPIIVTKSDNGFYKIVAGERRWRASKKAGLKEIPAIVRELSEMQTQEIALIENLQRQNLNPVEEALGYKRLMDEFSLSQEEVAKKLGKSRSSVANSVRILALPKEVIDFVKSGEISFGHAKVILSAKEDTDMINLAKEVVSKGLSVRDTELIINQKPKKEKKKTKKDLNVALAFSDIEKKLTEQIGAKVKIKSKGNKGSVQIEYYSGDELERIIKILGKK